MSKVSVLRRHRELFWALSIAALIAALSYIEVLSIAKLPTAILASVFIGILTGIVVILVFFQRYGEVIERAKENGMLLLIKRVFLVPMAVSAIGLTYLVLVTFIKIDLGGVLDYEEIQTITILYKSILVFFVIYSIFSFAECISFVYRVMIGESGNRE